MIKRSDFPILENKKIIYFDNASTSLKPQAVIESEADYYSNYGVNVHRGLSPLAEETTSLFEASRKKVADFINAGKEEIIFTSGATMSINLVARTWGEYNLKKGDKVILSIAEHHANIVPWLQLKEKIGIEISYIPLSEDGSLDIKAAYELLSRKSTKVLSVAHVSNVLGTVFPVKELIAFARKKGVVTIIDASASVSHFPLDVKSLGCDFLVFSAHKIFGPTGVGILYARSQVLDRMPAFLGGGSMIDSVSKGSFKATQGVAKLEAGTPNVGGVIATGAAIDFIKKITWQDIIRKEIELSCYFLKKIEKLRFVEVLGNQKERVPIFSLKLRGLHPHDAADLLGQKGIIVRAGHHCAQPLHDYLRVNSSLRISLSFYNTKKEIDFLVKSLEQIHKDFE